MNMLVKVIRVPKILSPLREERTLALRERESVESLCRRAFPDLHKGGSVCYSVDGRRVTGESDTDGAQLVACWTTPGIASMTAAFIAWGATELVASIAAYTVAGLAVSAVASAVSFGTQKLLGGKAAKNKYNKSQEDLSDANYGWDSSVPNAQQEGAPVPVLYGRRLVAPPMLSHGATIYNEMQVSYKEVCYAVADRGAGLEDVITYPRDDEGRYIARINENSWINYNNEDFNDRPVSSKTNLALVDAGVGRFTYLNTSSVEVNADWLGNGNETDYQSITSKRTVYFNLNPNIYIIPQTMKISLWSDRYANYAKIYGQKTDGGEWVLLGKSNKSTKGDDRLTVHLSPAMMVSRIRINFYNSEGASVQVSEIQIFGDTDSGGTNPNLQSAYVETKDADSDEPISFVQNVSSVIEMDKNLETDDYIQETSAKCAPDRIGIQFSLPQGLYHIDNTTGKNKDSSLIVTARYRAVSTNGTKGTWTNFFNSTHGDTKYCKYTNGNLKITATSTTELDFQFFIAPTPPADLSYYEVSVRYAEPLKDDQYYIGFINWNALIEQWGIPGSDDPAKTFIPLYPDTYVCGTRLLAGERLNKSVNKFQIEAERATVYVWNAVKSKWETKDASNPAWACYDLIVQPRFGTSTNTLLRERYDHKRMLYSEFADWADYCAQEGIYCSMYFDNQSTIADGLEYLTVLGRAVLVNKAGCVGVAIDRAWPVVDSNNAPVPAFAFTDDNIVKNTFKLSIKDRSEFPSVMEITYFDKDSNYERNTVMAFDNDLDNDSHARVVQTATLYACSDEGVAQAYAEFAIKANMIRMTASWTGDLDSMPCEIGDLVSVKGRLFTITGTSFDGEMRRQFSAQEYVPARFGQNSPA